MKKRVAISMLVIFGVFGLIVEALTAGLGGAGGRHEAGGQAGNTVFLQVIDPEAFGGADYLAAEMDWLGDACRASPPLADGAPVRVPGDRAAEAFREQRERGLLLHPEIRSRVEPVLSRYGVAWPEVAG